ncbi:MAG: MopE-related protein [Polyangiales bacterium]
MRPIHLSMFFVAAVGCSAAHEPSPPTSPGVDSGPIDGPVDARTPGEGGPRDDATGGLGDVAVKPTSDFDSDGYDLVDDCDDGNALINPGAIEVPGDAVDNDCNGSTDEALVDCDHDLPLASTDALDFARALGLCRTATAGAKGKARTWGVISAALTTSDASGAPLPRQFAIQSQWGDAVTPRAGKSLVALSSGVARTPGQPGYVALPKGTDSSSHVNDPPSGWPRNTKGCPSSSTKKAFDSVVLDLVIRVPTNAKSFSYDLDFYSSEYVEYVCQAYNDSFVAMLVSKTKLDPAAGGNISFDGSGDPINVNSGFFQACSPDSWLGRSFGCPLGITELAGTGFDALASSLTKPAQNGATSWLRTTQAIVAGEEIELKLMIWNTGDHWLPSTILLDRFVWSADKATGSTTDRPPR